jgi:hypothetical protein
MAVLPLLQQWRICLSDEKIPTRKDGGRNPRFYRRGRADWSDFRFLVGSLRYRTGLHRSKPMSYAVSAF